MTGYIYDASGQRVTMEPLLEDNALPPNPTSRV
jgi:hypothetical protein